MPNTKCEVVQGAWKLLRLYVSCAKKSSAFHRRAHGRFLRRLGHSTTPPQPHYAERQFSFDETPIFRAKMGRRATAADCFHIPCINPKVDLDFEFESCVEDGDPRLYSRQDEEDGIDLRAEKFINTFYEQMKMQSQIAYLQYNQISDD